MATKKLLSAILQERTETITYRAIRKNLMAVAQNGKNSYLILCSRLDEYSLTRLQNEGIEFTKIEEGGFHKFRMTW